ncbi:hypothetical protein H5410_056803 [Solanum commersonii]|uniref:Uncharacterized protein n=1 Tax=Solanum commersonii TaxID=4109 RepID=A0A9J5WMU1_SOLCO|nr:hypothetical protein H5410_056803 [Solanum commersonii]
MCQRTTLKNHKHRHYTLPFCIFDCPTLTYLDVTNFIVKQPSSKTLFPNLLKLALESIKFFQAKENYVLNTPLLSSLRLLACSCVHLLTKATPRIEELSFHEKFYYEEERFITWSLLSYLCSNLTKIVLINYCIQIFNTLRERNIGEVTHYREDPTCGHKQFEKLEFLELRKMIVETFDDIDVAEVLDLYEKLMMSLKTSPRVKAIVAPHGQAA